MISHRLIFLELVNIHIVWIKKLAAITYSVGPDMNLEAKNNVVWYGGGDEHEWADGNFLLGSFRVKGLVIGTGNRGKETIVLFHGPSVPFKFRCLD